eukprot:952604-Rhodomonas_salina.1
MCSCALSAAPVRAGTRDAGLEPAHFCVSVRVSVIRSWCRVGTFTGTSASVCLSQACICHGVARTAVTGTVTGSGSRQHHH